MKPLLKVLTGAVMLSLIFSGCKKDEPTVNYLQAGDVTCTLNDGNIILYGSGTYGDATFYRYAVEIFSPGVTLSTSGSGYPTYDGSGVKVYLSLFSTGTPRPSTGNDYVYHEWSSAVNALDGGNYSFDFVTSKTSYTDLSNGTVTLKNNGGDNFTITYEGTDEEYGEVKLQYTGDLKYYDGTGWMKK